MPESNPLQLAIGPFRAGVFGFIDSNGTWSFTAYAGFHLSAGPAYLDVDALLSVGPDHFRFHIHGAAGLRIAGFNIGVEVDADIRIQNNVLTVDLRACVDLLFGKICATVSFTLGTLQPPPTPSQAASLEQAVVSPPPPPPPILATVFPDGTLRLNVGPNAASRAAADYDGQIDETFTVSHDSSENGTETVSVSGFGFTQTYRGVRRIFADGGDGNDFLQVDTGVTSPAELHGRAGDDTLIYLGNSAATLDGGDGVDEARRLAGRSRATDRSEEGQHGQSEVPNNSIR